jgi:glutathione S-transferase
MRLIGSLTSPYVRKVRIVLAEKKLDYKFELDDPWSADNVVSDANPLGKVPCLVMEGGEAVFDSRVIVEYVDTLSPVGRLIPEKGRERAEVRTWEALADGLMDAAILARMEATWAGRSDAERSTAWIQRQLGKVEACTAAMARALGERPWCVGTHLSLADIATACALSYLDFRFPELAWREAHPVLVKLVDKLAQRQSFVDTRPPAA